MDDVFPFPDNLGYPRMNSRSRTGENNGTARVGNRNTLFLLSFLEFVLWRGRPNCLR
jgi:hypothetical protein